MRRAIAVVAFVTLACRPGSEEPGPAAPEDQAPETDAWAEVDRLVGAAVDQHQLPGIGLSVYDRDDRLVFQKMYRDFTAERDVAIASSSKLVSALVLLNLVDKGELTLASTTGEVLGWTGPKKAITLRHLLSFTSGLGREHTCTSNPLATLEQCVAKIAEAGLEAPVGTRFDYGSTHLHVAARMAEVVTGKTWGTLFRERLANPLGLGGEVRYYTAPKQATGTSNPLVAGGLRASMNDYALVLAAVFHLGTVGGQRIASAELLREQAREPFPSVVIGHSPVVDLGLSFRYGLGGWLECSTPASGCEVVSSPGAFGFVPWVDRQTGYYAVIGTELERSGEVVGATVSLAQALKPAIAQALPAPSH